MATVCILLPCHWDALKGGAEYQADCLARYITENTPHEVVYLARHVSKGVRNGPYAIAPIPAGEKTQKYGLFLDAPSLLRCLSVIAPDVIVQHMGCAYTGVAAWYCKMQGRPLIWYLASDIDVRRVKRPLSLNSIPERIDDLLLRYGRKNASVIVAQTHSQARELKMNYGRDAHFIVPNFHPLSSEKHLKPADLKVLWVGNLKRLKRPELFLKLANAFSSVPNVKFYLIGRREPSSWCEGVLDEVARTPNASYLGELSLEEVNEQLAGAHVLVNTSDYEGVPNTFIQAWMREAPVLSLNVDPDGVIAGHGLGLHARNMERMRDWLTDMASNRGALASIGQKARQFAERHYSMTNAERFTQIIDSALEPTSASRLHRPC
jgi:glycosyltransferase involved in cell wall biosynthesis